MPMRLSGLMSGMDTESIIQDIVAARRTKVDNAKRAQTKLSWKQEAWKGLNAKLKNLQSKYLNNMRFVSSYSKKTTKVSNSNAVSVITGGSAVNGVQSLQIKKLAKTGYLTGGEIEATNGRELSALSKLSDLGITEKGTFSIKAGSRAVDITVNGDTTISDVLTQLKGAGVNANFDAKQQRFFVSAKESGLANDFSITALDANGDAALAKLGLKVNLNDDKAALKEYEEYAKYYQDGSGDRTAVLDLINRDSRITKDITSRTNSYLEKYKSLTSAKEAAQKKIDDINEKYKDAPLKSVDEYKTELDAKNALIKEKTADLKDITDPDQKRAAEKELAELKKEAADITAQKKDAETLAAQTQTVADLDEQIAEVESYVNITAETAEDGTITYSAAATSKLTDEVNDRYYDKADYANAVMSSYDTDDTTATGATKVNGQDAEIILNGAMFTNSDNVFDINGLTITALNETKEGEEITITTQDDVDGIYDMVKNYLKEYNSIINEMDKLYNADSARGFEPLTDEEKDAMSEKEIEKYEEKIKDALFRRDSGVFSVSSALKEVMSSGISVNGKTMYLSDFGINTMGYFEAADNEKNAYHIDGDEDDANTSGKADVLKGMISNDPDTVIAFFSQLSKNMYAKMDSMSKSVDGYRSYGSFFDDKKMKSDYDDYTGKIAELERKLNEYEDKWYAKFSKMETAMAKLQKNTSAITSLLGGGT